MEAPEEIARPCKFDILFTKSVPHILETIFFSLDYESYTTCLDVSTTWRQLLTSESYKEKVKNAFHEEIDLEEMRLWNAAREGNVYVVRSLPGSVFLDVNCVKGWNESTPLCVAAMYAYKSDSNYKGVIQFLLKSLANPDLPNQIRWTPLHYAAQKGNIDVVQLLLNAGADPNKANNRGETPLHLVANKDVMQLLLDRGADPDSANCDGFTPLHEAAWSGDVDAWKLLLDKGANLNCMSHIGWTPLHYAVWRGNKDLVQLLLNAGAEPNKADNKGKTPLLIARERSVEFKNYYNRDIVNILNDALKQLK